MFRQAKGVIPTQRRRCDDGSCANVCSAGHSGLTITSSSFARRFYRPQTLHDRLLLRRDKLWRGASVAHKLRGKAEIPPRKAKRARKNRDQMRYVFGRENGPACIKVCLTGAIIIVDPLHSHHKLSGRIEQEAARAFVNKILRGSEI